MTISDIAHRAQRTVSTNSPAILTGIGVSGVLSTAYLVGKATFRVAGTIQKEQSLLDSKSESHPLTFKEKAKLSWKFYIPAAISGTLTITCVILGAKASASRTAAAVSLLTVSERAFDEYKSKVIETIGEKKEQAVRDQIVQDRVTANPPPTVVLGSGQVLCQEGYSGRYFMSDVETLKKAVNEINEKLLRHDEATLSDFYYKVNLPVTSNSPFAGWISKKLLELEWSTAVTDELPQRPCIVFDYNYIHPF